MAEVELSTLMGALADPVRLGIARTLADGREHACHEFDYNLTRATMSHHFRTLRQAGLIRTRVDGRQRFIRLRVGELRERFPGLLDLLQS